MAVMYNEQFVRQVLICLTTFSHFVGGLGCVLFWLLLGKQFLFASPRRTLFESWF